MELQINIPPPAGVWTLILQLIPSYFTARVIPAHSIVAGVDKIQNISGASIFFFLQIRAKKTMNLNLKIQAPGKHF
jgi:hypothetical protein